VFAGYCIRSTPIRVHETQYYEGDTLIRSLSVLVSGASIAGPALAYWLNRYGCTVAVVEKVPALRPGGQAVDFKGETHRQVLERMGLLDEVRRVQTGKTDLVIVDEHNKRLATIPGEFTGGDLEVLRGDWPRCCTSARQTTATTCSATPSPR
jgi:FAD binding domain